MELNKYYKYYITKYMNNIYNYDINSDMIEFIDLTKYTNLFRVGIFKKYTVGKHTIKEYGLRKKKYNKWLNIKLREQKINKIWKNKLDNIS